MDATTLAGYRHRLTVELRDIAQRVVALEDDLDTMAEELDVEIMDRVQEETWAALLAKLGDQDRAQAEEIQAALARIDAGTFGRCARCGEEIARARLDALPTARRCAACQEDEEARSERS